MRRASLAIRSDAVVAPAASCNPSPTAGAPAAPRRGQGDARRAQLQAAATAIAGRSLARRMTIARLADELSLSDEQRAALQEAVGWTGERVQLRKLHDTQTRALAAVIHTLG
jgi:hypothetical protein